MKRSRRFARRHVVNMALRCQRYPDVHVRQGDGHQSIASTSSPVMGWIGSCFGNWNKRQMRFEIALRRCVAAFDVSLDKPPNQIGRCGALSPGKCLELPENSFRKFHDGLHTYRCLTSA